MNAAGTLVIAHRGASGYLPEHTLEAKALAYGQGADYLEQDIVATRDGELVVLHDLYLDCVTDVAERFPERARPDGHYYVIDFDLAELRAFEMSERRRAGSSEPAYPGRFPVDARIFRIATLDEEIALVQGLNRSTGRSVGIYPEIKHPAWHFEHGVDLARLLLEKLDAHGYRHRDDPVYVQCFDARALRRARVELNSALKLVQLVDAGTDRRLLTASGLADVAAYAQGLGTAFAELVIPPSGTGEPPARSSLATQARAAGLLLHPYTFRREGLPAYADSLEQLLELFISKVGADAVFCDYPDVAVRVRDAVRAGGSPTR